MRVLLELAKTAHVFDTFGLNKTNNTDRMP
jgi:hypothetical protein